MAKSLGKIFWKKLRSRDSIALVVIDMQDAFVSPTGAISVPNGEKTARDVSRAVAVARAAGIAVIWTRVSVSKWVHAPYRELFPLHFDGNHAKTLDPSSPDFELTPRLRKLVREEDIIIDKFAYSAFSNPKFPRQLKKRGITHLLFCGLTTNVCIESTLRDAFQRNFYCALLTDASGTFSSALQSFSEEVIAYMFGWLTTIPEAKRQLTRIRKLK